MSWGRRGPRPGAKGPHGREPDRLSTRPVPGRQREDFSADSRCGARPQLCAFAHVRLAELANIAQNWSQLVLPGVLVFAFGRMAGDVRQGRALLITMAVIFVVALAVIWKVEAAGNPALSLLFARRHGRQGPALRPDGRVERGPRVHGADLGARLYIQSAARLHFAWRRRDRALQPVPACLHRRVHRRADDRANPRASQQEDQRPRHAARDARAPPVAGARACVRRAASIVQIARSRSSASASAVRTASARSSTPTPPAPPTTALHRNRGTSSAGDSRSADPGKWRLSRPRPWSSWNPYFQRTHSISLAYARRAYQRVRGKFWVVS